MDQIKNTFNEITKIAHGHQAEVELLIQGGEGLSLRYQNKKMEQFSSSQSQIAGFRVVKAGHQGYAYSENLDAENLKRCFKDALENCEMLLKSEGPKDEIPMAKAATANFKIQHFNQADSTDIELKKKLAADLELKTLEKNPMVVNVPYSALNESYSWSRVLNSLGVDQTYEKKYFMAYAGPLMQKINKKKSAFFGMIKPRLNDLNADQVAAKAIEKTLPYLDAQKLTTGKYPTMIANDVVAKFMQMLDDALSAKTVFEGKSFLNGQLGKKIFSEIVTLQDDPLNDFLIGSRPVDSEGSISQKTTIIENGVFKSFLTNLEFAKKMNLPHTASAARSPRGEMGIGLSNLVMTKGQKTKNEILSSYPMAVVITSVQGGLHAGFNDTTGDFSLPVEGLVFEHDKLVKAFDQTVVSGNILSLLKDVIDLSSEYPEDLNQGMFPDLMIKELSFAGQSN